MLNGEGRPILIGEDLQPDEGWATLQDSKDLPPFWKPQEPGDYVVGVLVRVKDTQFGPALRIRQADDKMVVCPIWESMKDVDYSGLIGRRLRLVYRGKIETKGGNGMEDVIVQVEKLKVAARTAMVRKEAEEEVPF